MRGAAAAAAVSGPCHEIKLTPGVNWQQHTTAVPVCQTLSIMAAATRCIALKSGCTMPCIGLGTFLATKPGEVGAAVKAAVSSGYRLIDCAAGYGNQAEIGEALQEIFAEGMVKREDLFIVSKLFQTHHGKRGPLRWLAVDRAACTRAGWKGD